MRHAGMQLHFRPSLGAECRATGSLPFTVVKKPTQLETITQEMKVLKEKEDRGIVD